MCRIIYSVSLLDSMSYNYSTLQISSTSFRLKACGSAEGGWGMRYIIIFTPN